MFPKNKMLKLFVKAKAEDKYVMLSFSFVVVVAAVEGNPLMLADNDILREYTMISTFESR